MHVGPGRGPGEEALRLWGEDGKRNTTAKTAFYIPLNFEAGGRGRGGHPHQILYFEVYIYIIATWMYRHASGRVRATGDLGTNRPRWRRWWRVRAGEAATGVGVWELRRCSARLIHVDQATSCGGTLTHFVAVDVMVIVQVVEE